MNADRADEYRFLATLLSRAPGADLLDRIASLTGDGSLLGDAHGALAAAARIAQSEAVGREHFTLFTGVGRGELLPYASYYLTGFLNERPLAALRRDLGVLGLARAEGQHDPEDNIVFLCEVMAELAGHTVSVPGLDEAAFFLRHLEPWAGRFFADLASAPSAVFYRAVGNLGATFIEIETGGFALEAAQHGARKVGA